MAVLVATATISFALSGGLVGHRGSRALVRGQIVFLDRDGVINRKIEDGYVTRWSEFEFLPGVKEAIRRLKEADCGIYVVSNQACVNRGRVTREELDEITERMLSEIREAGGEVHDVAYCPHRPDEG